MEKLIIHSHEQCPCVKCDKENNIFEIVGKSFAKYSRDVYHKILEWLNEYIKNPNEETIAVFRLEFYDTSSAKFILEIFKKLNIIVKQHKKVEVHWYYPDDDEDIEEAGEIYAHLIDIPVKSFPYSREHYL